MNVTSSCERGPVCFMSCSSTADLISPPSSHTHPYIGMRVIHIVSSPHRGVKQSAPSCRALLTIVLTGSLSSRQDRGHHEGNKNRGEHDAVPQSEPRAEPILA